MSADDTISPDDAALAAEYAMGLLPDDARAEFEARLRTDAGLAAETRAWTETLVRFTDEVAEDPPRPAVKRALMTRIEGPARPRGLRFWQGLSVLGLAAAAGMAVLLYTDLAQRHVGPAPVYVAEIAAPDDSLRLLAVYETGTGTLRLTRTEGAARTGRALELWVIAGNDAPRSLGVLPGDPNAAILVPEALRAVLAGATLAISDEPPTGSPTGAPTGDVLAVGAVATL